MPRAPLPSGVHVVANWITGEENPSGEAVKQVLKWLELSVPFGSPKALVQSVHPVTGAYHIVDEVQTDDGLVRITWVASKRGGRIRFKTCGFAAPDVT